MSQCSSCGKENREGARFCSKCSTPLEVRPFVDFYTLFGLSPDASSADVRQALHEAARAHMAEALSEQLEEAIRVLGDAQRRADYDRQRLAHLAEQRFKRADLKSEDYYRRLGVSPFARRRDIQDAFEQLRTLADRGRITRGGLVRLEEAYACLHDPIRRRAYDQSLVAAARLEDVPVPHEFNYYDYLGLDRTATEDQIRKADAAVRGHLTPRAKSGDEAADAALRELNQIIQVLTDTSGKRQAYDNDPLHDVFRFQTPGRATPATRQARFAVLENIVYGTQADGLAAFGGVWPDDQN